MRKWIVLKYSAGAQHKGVLLFLLVKSFCGVWAIKQRHINTALCEEIKVSVRKCGGGLNDAECFKVDKKKNPY